MQASTSKSSILKPILPRVPNDPQKLRDAFEGGKLLPYAGNAAKSNHSFAWMLQDLSAFSNSRGTCHEDIATYSFNSSGPLEVRSYNRNGFKKNNQRELSDAESDAYADALSEFGITGQGLKDQATELFKQYATTGCAFLLNDRAKVGDETALNSRATGIDSTILWDDKEGRRYAIYFPHGIDRNLDSNAQHFVYPLFSTSTQVLDAIEAGELSLEDSGLGYQVYRYAFQIKNGSGAYGRPKDIQAIREMLTEAGAALHAEKVSIAPTTARGIITYPANPTKHEDFEKPTVDADGNEIEASQSAEEDFKEMVAHTRQTLDNNDLGFLPYEGELAPGLLKLDIPRDARFLTAQNDIIVAKIHAANRWSTDLTGVTAPSGGIGSGYFADLVRYKNKTVIEAYQMQFAMFQNETIATVITDERFQDVIHAFTNPLEGLEFNSESNNLDNLDV